MMFYFNMNIKIEQSIKVLLRSVVTDEFWSAEIYIK